VFAGSIVGVAREKPAAPSKLRRVGAMMSSFVVSGLIHEVMLWYVLHTTDGRWLAFFSLQARHCPEMNNRVMTILAAIFRSLEVPLVLDHRQTHVYHCYQTMCCIRTRDMPLLNMPRLSNLGAVLVFLLLSTLSPYLPL